ncbi:alpha/beta fold hydrolase, partial [Cribrihabitans sp. XS_ASV171]
MTNPLIAARDAFAARHPEQRFEREGRDWGYIDCGEGPALLLIPGTLGRADIFWQQIEALQDHLRIIAVSYPASGGVADWAGDLVALLDRLGIDTATVLGSSLGGYLAQYMASAAPARVTALVAANTLHSVRGLEQRMPYALELDTAPIEDLRAGFGAGLSAWADSHTDQRDLVALL